jgi:hypothetical protein
VVPDFKRALRVIVSRSLRCSYASCRSGVLGLEAPSPARLGPLMEVSCHPRPSGRAGAWSRARRDFSRMRSARRSVEPKDLATVTVICHAVLLRDFGRETRRLISRAIFGPGWTPIPTQPQDSAQMRDGRTARAATACSRVRPGVSSLLPRAEHRSDRGTATCSESAKRTTPRAPRRLGARQAQRRHLSASRSYEASAISAKK